jgi:hypothetical protein
VNEGRLEKFYLSQPPLFSAAYSKLSSKATTKESKIRGTDTRPAHRNARQVLITVSVSKSIISILKDKAILYRIEPDSCGPVEAIKPCRLKVS